MKLTNKINELVCELEMIEVETNVSLFERDGAVLRKTLLELYRKTDDPRSHDLIIQIMAEGGYPWFEKLAKNKASSLICSLKQAHEVIESDTSSFTPLSEDDFMELLPANGHFH